MLKCSMFTLDVNVDAGTIIGQVETVEEVRSVLCSDRATRSMDKVTQTEYLNIEGGSLNV